MVNHSRFRIILKLAICESIEVCGFPHKISFLERFIFVRQLKSVYSYLSPIREWQLISYNLWMISRKDDVCVLMSDFNYLITDFEIGRRKEGLKLCRLRRRGSCFRINELLSNLHMLKCRYQVLLMCLLNKSNH